MSKLFRTVITLAVGYVAFTGCLRPATADDSGMGWPSTWAAPLPAGIANLQPPADFTRTACDPTGHCARLHVVAQVQDSVQMRTYASVTCYSSTVASTPCAALQGSATLGCTRDNGAGADCSAFSGVKSCGARYGAAACPAVLSVVTPWVALAAPPTSRWWDGASFQFTTGAAGGGTPTISGASPTFIF